MYYYNGFVCGGEPEEAIKVIKVKPLQDQIMLLTFNNGETRLFDATALTGPVFSALQDDQVFMSPVLDHGVVTWKEGEIDCAPEFMYKNSFDYAQVV
ncbi:MAG: DUF2442 domain-containing protein [Oscillospiraceae bacterium]|nr:DUF2442 domain-containing protein [Oscillospiraceae bacterium]